MHAARQQMVAAPLRRGALVVAGGKGTNGALSGTEIFAFATLDTDKADYSPGEQATFTGTGWKPGEQVLVQVAAFPLDQHSIEFTVRRSGGFHRAHHNCSLQHRSQPRRHALPRHRHRQRVAGPERLHRRRRKHGDHHRSHSRRPAPSTPLSRSPVTCNRPAPPTRSIPAPWRSAWMARRRTARPPSFPPAAISPRVPSAVSCPATIRSAPPIAAAAHRHGTPALPAPAYQVTTPTTTTLNSPAAASAPLGTAVRLPGNRRLNPRRRRPGNRFRRVPRHQRRQRHHRHRSGCSRCRPSHALQPSRQSLRRPSRLRSGHPTAAIPPAPAAPPRTP